MNSIEQIGRAELEGKFVPMGRRLLSMKRQSQCSSGKIQHSDGLSALNHMSRLRFNGTQASSYVCPQCGFIHITTSRSKKHDHDTN